MKIISFEDVKKLNITPVQCYEWVSDAIEHKGDAMLPAKISLKPEMQGVFYNTMPAILPFANCAGVKLVTRYPQREPSLDSQILLYELSTGKHLAVIDGNWITAMRTGAVAAHSIKLLAKSDFFEIGFIGLGNTARAAMKSLLAIYPEKRIKVRLKKYKNQHILFADSFRNNNLEFIYCDTIEDTVANSDVIVSAATCFEGDICDINCYREGVLVVPIHTRGFMNCDLHFDKIYADDTNHVKGFKYFNQYKNFAEISDIISGKNCGRENDKQRIIAYNIGIALHDIYFAKKIYELAQGDAEISLKAPKDKFWV